VAGLGVAGLAALVVAGLGPARTPPLEVADAATNRVPVAVVAPVPADHRGWPPSQPAIEAIAPVSLSAPIRQTGPLTGPTVPVRGKLLIRAASVRVQLETNDRHALATAVVDTANRDGGIRPLHAPSVDVVLRIPMPRPVGWLWLVITAYDGAGTPIATMRRAVDVGAARESARR
jgi:hypothetical protein